ncbi:carotenoid biosynthesis protein [Arcicella aquatica]|uniref:Carotenoid biosynthesis protein n=1 Tax=Arcicella aquatica TaxID=217141 RepID=A0ABU5QM19_9BACT|nr:carotenoid biosynthesis protein [Arcicella aquatica]MEA5258112.1 carotenoid biosynthesis protein [Arcicella aquatica]
MNLSTIQTLLNTRYRKIVFTILSLMYLVGFIGLMIPLTREYFKLLSPFNLWISLILLLLFQQDFQLKFILFAIITFLIGFFVEVLGVHTGIIFGQYYYGKTLGIQLFDVPIVIGANWFILVYSSGHIIEKLFKNLNPFFGRNILLSTVAASLMVCLDLIIEPVAIRLDFWQWHFNKIPIQNYVGWFIISFGLQYYFISSKFLKNNALAPLLFYLQFIFFLLHSIFST